MKNLSQQTAIHEAAKVGDLALFEECFKIVFPTDDIDGDEIDFAEVHPYDAVSKLTTTYGRNLMHEACRYGRVDVIRFLFERCQGLADARDEMKLTPLHLACKMNHVDAINVMFEARNQAQRAVADTPSLLRYASKKGSIEALLALFENTADAGQISETLIDLLKWLVNEDMSEIIKVLLHSLDNVLQFVPDQDLNDLALLSAKCGQERCLVVLKAWKPNMFRDGKDCDENTALHLAASNDSFSCVRILLKSDMELYTHDKKNRNEQTPLHIAVEHNHYSSCQMLIGRADKQMLNARDIKGRTALHLACRNGNMSIMELLLARKDDLDITIKDKAHTNCLDHAIKSGQEMTAIKLLELKEWEVLMKNSTQEHGNQSGFRTTPMRKLICDMPVAAKFVLDKCIRLKEIKPKAPDNKQHESGADGTDSGETQREAGAQEGGEDKQEVELLYEFLDDWFSDWMEKPSGSSSANGSTDTNRRYHVLPGKSNAGQPVTNATRNATHDYGKNWTQDGGLIDDAKPYVTDTDILNKNHPLNIMITSDNKELLNHPVVVGLCRYKWTRMGRTAFWSTLFIYVAFLISLTGHVMVIPPTFYILLDDESPNGYTWLADGKARWVDRANAGALFYFGRLGGWIVLVLALINFTLTLIRIGVQQKSLLTTGELFNLVLDIVPQCLAILVILPIGSVHYMNGVNFKPNWQWECGAIAVFLVWMNFIIFLKRVPVIGIYVLMVIYVFRSFLNFMIVFGLFLFSFAVVFNILLLNQSPFNNLGVALAKTLAMTSGEIDFGTIVQPFDYLNEVDVQSDFLSIVFYPIGTNIVMAVFIIIMPILVSNLLTGLAVDDVGEIQRKAKIYGKTIEIKAMLAVERSLLFFFWRRSVIRMESITLKTRAGPVKKFFYRLTGFKESYDYLLDVIKDYGVNEGPVETDKTLEMRFDELAERVMVIDTKLSMITPAHSKATKGTMSTDDLNQKVTNNATKLDKVLEELGQIKKKGRFRDIVKGMKN